MTRNRWYDIPLLLSVSAIMFRPDFFGRLGGFGNHYYMYLAGLGLWAAIYMLQKVRDRGGQVPVI